MFPTVSSFIKSVKLKKIIVPYNRPSTPEEYILAATAAAAGAPLGSNKQMIAIDSWTKNVKTLSPAQQIEEASVIFIDHSDIMPFIKAARTVWMDSFTAMDKNQRFAAVAKLAEGAIYKGEAFNRLLEAATDSLRIPADDFETSAITPAFDEDLPVYATA